MKKKAKIHRGQKRTQDTKRVSPDNPTVASSTGEVKNVDPLPNSTKRTMTPDDLEYSQWVDLCRLFTEQCKWRNDSIENLRNRIPLWVVPICALSSFLMWDTGKVLGDCLALFPQNGHTCILIALSQIALVFALCFMLRIHIEYSRVSAKTPWPDVKKSQIRGSKKGFLHFLSSDGSSFFLFALGLGVLLCTLKCSVNQYPVKILAPLFLMLAWYEMCSCCLFIFLIEKVSTTSDLVTLKEDFVTIENNTIDDNLNKDENKKSCSIINSFYLRFIKRMMKNEMFYSKIYEILTVLFRRLQLSLVLALMFVGFSLMVNTIPELHLPNTPTEHEQTKNENVLLHDFYIDPMQTLASGLSVTAKEQIDNCIPSS